MFFRLCLCVYTIKNPIAHGFTLIYIYYITNNTRNCSLNWKITLNPSRIHLRVVYMLFVA